MSRKLSSTKQQNLVVAEKRSNVAAALSGLALESHDQVDNVNAAGTTIAEIARKPQSRSTTTPVQLVIHKPRGTEKLAYLVELTVRVSNYKQAVHSRGL